MFQRVTLKLIKVYQNYLRILLPSSCRFIPSCSEYAAEAIIRYGFFKGAFKGIRRLFSCHPFSQRAGYDPLT